MSNNRRSNQSKGRLAVHGYVRINFVDDCWVNEIIQIIIQYFLNKGGSLFMCGNGEFGQLGIEEYENKICKKFTVCPPFNHQNALDVSAGREHTLILDIDGQVWSCGTGKYGKLGNGKTENISSPQMLNLAQKVIAVCAGGWHSLILLENGYVQSFGCGIRGRLGHGNEETQLNPKTIATLKQHKIIQIAAGGWHSCVLSEQGDMFCFGASSSGECGVGEEVGNEILTPTKVQFDDKIAFIASGDSHNLCITQHGLLHSFGCGFNARLGHGDERHKYIPTLIQALKNKIIQTCAAGNSHSIFIDKEGIVWAFGDNHCGQCGSETDGSSIPEIIEYFSTNKIKAKNCAAGGDRSCIITHDGSLYLFGSQLGFENEEICIHIPEKLSLPQNITVWQVSMGSSHTAMISSSELL